jgi:hypothetical protein
MKIALWIFPPEDFADWCQLVGSHQVDSHAAYLDLIAAVQADQERQGRDVQRVKMTVSEMKSSLEKHGLENTPDGRATALVLK